MSRRIYDDELHAHFVTFSCYRRRRLMDHDRPKQIVVEMLASQLARQRGRCFGFVVMPDHVHALVWFARQGHLSVFMKHWKQRSSFRIKEFLRRAMPKYAATFRTSRKLSERETSIHWILWRKVAISVYLYCPRHILTPSSSKALRWNAEGVVTL